MMSFRKNLFPSEHRAGLKKDSSRMTLAIARYECKVDESDFYVSNEKLATVES